MSEHAHHHAEDDHFGKRVSLTATFIGVVLAIVTILGHRAHTNAILTRSEANDLWAFYQAKKIRENSSDVGNELLGNLCPAKTDCSQSRQKLQELAQRYKKEADDIKKQAEEKMRKTEESEACAIRFDISEGLMELSLVVTSLYFLSRRQGFVNAGLFLSLVGAAVALSVLLLGS